MTEYSCLSISREEFRKIYNGLDILEHEELFYSRPQTEKELYFKYFPSKLWRLNNCYTIVDKYGTRINFTMNRAQHQVYADSLRHPRLVILKSRQQGISTFWLVSFFDDGCTKPDTSIGLMAQGQDEASTLLERTKILWDTFHPDYKKFLNIRVTVDNTKEFRLSNGSNIFIRTSFRSATLQRLHISEMGKIANKSPEKAKETKTGTLQAIAQGNTAVIESTAEGDNMFKDMWDNAVMYNDNLSLKDFKPIFLSWVNDPDCRVNQPQKITKTAAKYFEKLEKQGYSLDDEQKWFWVVQYRELGDKIYQEYPTTAAEAFMATKQGAYWADLYYEFVHELKREEKDLYDENLAVQLSVDLGMDDTNVLNVFQYYKHFRIIDEFADNGQRIKYYCDWIKDQPWFENLTHIILPHDAEVTELTSGKTRTEVFDLELNCDANGNYERESYERVREIYVTVLPRTKSLNEDIEGVRQIISDLRIDVRCEYLKYCLLNYQKEWDDKREVWKPKPLHNEASNGAAAIRYMNVGADKGAVWSKKKKGETVTEQIQRMSRGSFDV